MLQATAVFETENASRYLQAMFRHFAHKVDVAYDNVSGSAKMPHGELKIRADDSLMYFEVQAATLQDLLKTRYVVDAHIVRFAFREKLLGLKWESAEIEPVKGPGEEETQGLAAKIVP